MMYSFGPNELAGMLGLSVVALGVLVVVISAWSIFWKGFALWYAARGSQKWWFIALLIVNTVGILEIIYLLFFRPKAPYKKTGDKTADAISSAVN